MKKKISLKKDYVPGKMYEANSFNKHVYYFIDMQPTTSGIKCDMPIFMFLEHTSKRLVDYNTVSIIPYIKVLLQSKICYIRYEDYDICEVSQ